MPTSKLVLGSMVLLTASALAFASYAQDQAPAAASSSASADVGAFAGKLITGTYEPYDFSNKISVAATMLIDPKRLERVDVVNVFEASSFSSSEEAVAVFQSSIESGKAALVTMEAADGVGFYKVDPLTSANDLKRLSSQDGTGGKPFAILSTEASIGGVSASRRAINWNVPTAKALNELSSSQPK